MFTCYVIAGTKVVDGKRTTVYMYTCDSTTQYWDDNPILADQFCSTDKAENEMPTTIRQAKATLESTTIFPVHKKYVPVPEDIFIMRRDVNETRV